MMICGYGPNIVDLLFPLFKTDSTRQWEEPRLWFRFPTVIVIILSVARQSCTKTDYDVMIIMEFPQKLQLICRQETLRPVPDNIGNRQVSVITIDVTKAINTKVGI
jgi:hypothetical protein